MEKTLTGMLGELQDMRKEINLIHNSTLRSKCQWTIVKKVDKGTEKIKSNSRNGQVIKGY